MRRGARGRGALRKEVTPPCGCRRGGHAVAGRAALAAGDRTGSRRSAWSCSSQLALNVRRGALACFCGCDDQGVWSMRRVLSETPRDPVLPPWPSPAYRSCAGLAFPNV
jgi:hypothetical protein